MPFAYIKEAMRDPDFNLTAFSAILKPGDAALLAKLIAEDQLLQDVEDFLFYAGCVITDISVNGLVTFETSEYVHTHQNYTEITKETLQIDLFTYDEDMDRFEESELRFDIVPVKFEQNSFTV